MTITEQMQRGSGSSWSDIVGAIDPSTYVPVSADVGLYLRVKESNGGVLAYSLPLGPIVAAGTPNAVTDRWFAPTAAVNVAIPSNPPIHPQSAQIIANFVPQTTLDNQPPQFFNYQYLGPRNRDPVAYVDVAAPLVTIQVNWPDAGSRFQTAPIPAGQVLTQINNENYLVLLVSDGSAYNFWNVTPPGVTPYQPRDWGSQSQTHDAVPNQYYQAIVADHYPMHSGWQGDGKIDSAYGGDGYLLEGYGIIRKRDFVVTPSGGHFDHAINWTGFANCAASNTLSLPKSVPPCPSYAGDGTYTVAGCFPFGMRLQLDPALNVNTWPSLVSAPEWQRQLARTLQIYGQINCHSAGGTEAYQHSQTPPRRNSQGDGDGYRTEYSTTPGDYPWMDGSGNWPGVYDSLLNLPSDLASHFRVIDWTRWTGE